MRKILGVLAIIGIGAFFYGQYQKAQKEKNAAKLKK
jgi:hypothetical protein